jgi:RecA/RadA recombinase
MTFVFRPAVRASTPLIIGLAGPTKSGKTLSAHRLAAGLANGGVVAMLNAEGARGHQYADRFNYVACDIDPPFSPSRYTAAITEAAKLNPAVLIIDSASHMHDGPGGMLEFHDAELDRMAGPDDWKKRERMTWTAWIRPKKEENQFIYAMLGLRCPVILCFRAKEKMKIQAGKPPIDLGWQPIASDRIAFETIFTLVLPPHSKGVPDLSISEMREPFDSMVKEGRQLDEELGRTLAEWAAGSAKSEPPPADTAYITANQALDLEVQCRDAGVQVARLLKKANVERLEHIRVEDLPRAQAYIKSAAQTVREST